MGEDNNLFGKECNNTIENYGSTIKDHGFYENYNYHQLIFNGSKLIDIENNDDQIQTYENSMNFKSNYFLEEVTIISNTVNALLGVSIFAMPWGFQQSGIVAGTILLAIISSLSFETARIMLTCQKAFFHSTGEVKGYPEIASSTLGPMWAIIVQSATIISCLGSCVGSLIFFGETVGQLFGISSDKIVLMATVPLILLSWTKTFHDLTIFSVFAVFSLIIAVVVVILDGLFIQQKDHSLTLTMWTNASIIEPSTFSNFIGPATFLFTIHYYVLSLGAESLRLKPWLHTKIDSPHDDNEPIPHPIADNSDGFSSITAPIGWAYFIALVLITCIGVSGVLLFRDAHNVKDHAGNVLFGCEDHICQNIILNLSAGYMRDTVGVCLSITILLSYILIFVPAREHIERIVLRINNPITDTGHTLARNALRSILVLLTVTVAICAPYFGYVMGVVGGFTDAFQCFVLPPLIYTALFQQKITRQMYAFYGGILCMGVSIILYTSIHTIQIIIGD